MDFKPDFLGYNFLWFIGVVEDRNDPLKLGRVRVRCFGWHSTDKNELKTEDLPWAQTIQPVTAPSAAASGLTEGIWVFGFFMDGDQAQRPMIMGQIPGYNFDDENNGESELPRAARVEDAYPSLQSETRKQKIETNIAKDYGSEEVWNEPQEPQDALYPYVQTISSESGILTQVVNRTDTGESRKTEYHPSGTYKEINTNGDNITKIVNDNYEIIANDSYAYIKGNVFLTIDSDCTTNIKGNWKINVNGDKEEIIGGNHKVTIGKQLEQTADSHSLKLGGGTLTTTGEIDGRTVTAGASGLKVSLTTHKHTALNVPPTPGT